MNAVAALAGKTRVSLCAISLVLIAALVPISLVLLIHQHLGVELGVLTRDPNAVLGAPLYVGLLSQAGIFFWAAAAAVSLFSWSLVSAGPDRRDVARFLMASFLLSAFLGLDDAFLLHEEFFPSIGVGERRVYAAYVGTVLLYLFAFRRLILQTDYVLLAMALAFLALSMSLDWLQPDGFDVFIVEDSAKLIGIVSWAAYFFRTGRMCAGKVPSLQSGRPVHGLAGRGVAP